MEQKIVIARYRLVKTHRRLTLDVIEQAKGVEWPQNSGSGLTAAWVRAPGVEDAIRSSSTQYCTDSLRDAAYDSFVKTVDLWAHSHGGVAIDEEVQTHQKHMQLLAFAHDLMGHWPYGDINGDELERAAHRHGLLKKTVQYKPCAGEGCLCSENVTTAEWASGVDCFHKTATLLASA